MGSPSACKFRNDDGILGEVDQLRGNYGIGSAVALGFSVN